MTDVLISKIVGTTVQGRFASVQTFLCGDRSKVPGPCSRQRLLRSSTKRQNDWCFFQQLWNHQPVMICWMDMQVRTYGYSEREVTDLRFYFQQDLCSYQHVSFLLWSWHQARSSNSSLQCQSRGGFDLRSCKMLAIRIGQARGSRDVIIIVGCRPDSRLWILLWPIIRIKQTCDTCEQYGIHVPNWNHVGRVSQRWRPVSSHFFQDGVASHP